VLQEWEYALGNAPPYARAAECAPRMIRFTGSGNEVERRARMPENVFVVLYKQGGEGGAYRSWCAVASRPAFAVRRGRRMFQ